MLEGTFSDYMNVNVQCTSMSNLENTNREPEELEGGVQQLAGLELHGVGEGDAEDQEVQGEVGGEDGQDVELVSRVVVVQVVPRLAVSQPELVPQPETLDMSSAMKYLMYIIFGESCAPPHLGGLAVADGYEPPPLPRSLEVSGSAAPDHGRVVVRDEVALAAAVDRLVGQVDELVVLHLQHALLVPAASQVGLVSVDQGPLGLGVVIKVKVLGCVVL